ncbi:P-loop containing nucleoside triphosphate hydrolase protein [Lineolata rhizophorae]|uniref:P-loop containing nucleoside triphosphate hydrolase protein n=1 Tax=Lineolata rhizophorae TaxID=578093 RepID=A0A6A6NSC0_9PEZI|nr:P-loop containing nucleoside triphosphate hydrolase protein [Lineolata rhizophorae]
MGEGDLDIETESEEGTEDEHHEVVSVSSTTSGYSDNNDDATMLPDTERPRVRDGHYAGKRVEWSDDEDAGAAYTAFKKRKLAKGKHPGRPPTTKMKKAEPSVVGKRSVKKPDHTAPKKRRWTVLARDASESGSETNAENLPDYVLSRKADFDRANARLGESALKLPPKYDDIYFSDGERMADLREKPVFPNMKPCSDYKDIILPSAGIIPAPVAQWLRNYQVEGARFLHELFVWQKGGILGDDMGLGKTIQVIAFLTAAFGKTGDERDAKRMRKVRRAKGNHWYPRVLIVCPGTLMRQWQFELQKWGWWQVYRFHGSTEEKESTLQAASSGRLEVALTTYTTYRMNKSAVNTIDWDCIIADECHMIKGRSAETTKAMNEINSLCRIGLTGTAIQNNYEELWTLLNWTNPGMFGTPSTWKEHVSKPLRIGQAHDATVPELARARKTARMLVDNLLPQFFLRRMKTLIADQLPKKSDRVVFCPLTGTQAAAYDNLISSPDIEYIRTSAEICPCGSNKKRGWCHYKEIPERGKWQNAVFPSIATLQKLANHIALLIPSTNDSRDKQDKDLENLQVAVPGMWQELYEHKDSIMNYANPEFCGKWKILKKLLNFWDNQSDKVLIFSHSVRLLKMLYVLFTASTSYQVSYLDGSMTYEQRAQVVDDFNSDPSQFVFLISTKAGGVGLNITAANKIVVVDPNWNPSYDLQAQDRAYRIGQTRDVEVFRLVSAGTIEEIVYARQIYKQQQANIGYNASNERRYFQGVMNVTEKKGEIFGLENLFSFNGDNVVLRDIVNKTNVAESKAGVRVVDVNLSQSQQDNDERSENLGPDAAMNEIAAEVKDERDDNVRETQKIGAVQAILASAGVQYTHENSEVIGSSKVEARISKRAEARAGDAAAMKANAFGESDSAESSTGPDYEDLDLTEDIKFQYKPPLDVRKRQFCTMAKTFGFSDPTEFALIVESWTQEQRRNALMRFYQMRREKLARPDGGHGC